MPLEPLGYAPGECRSPPRWRRRFRKLVRGGLLAILAVIPVGVGYVSYRYPWIWYGSRDVYQHHRMLTFTMPPDQVVYEEDPARAAKLLALPPDPRAAYVGDPKRLVYGTSDRDYSALGEVPCAEYSPPFYRSLFGMNSAWTLVFIHERIGPSGRRRLVLVSRGSVYPQEEYPNVRELAWRNRRNAIWISARSDAVDEPFHLRKGNGHHLHLPLRPEQMMRIYAGQPDPNDAAHFTIKYEIDNVPGTIDGRLEADDTVTLRILDGPAATRPSGHTASDRTRKP